MSDNIEAPSDGLETVQLGTAVKVATFGQKLRRKSRGRESLGSLAVQIDSRDGRQSRSRSDSEDRSARRRRHKERREQRRKSRHQKTDKTLPPIDEPGQSVVGIEDSSRILAF